MLKLARGQALAETVIFLPLALLTLSAVIWAAQYGVMSERVQSAIRYSGLVSNQINPYQEYSFYVLYNSLGPALSSNAPIPSQTCVAPNVSALQAAGSTKTTGSPFPGQTSGPFWEATSAPATTTCLTTNSQTASFTSGMNQTALALSNTPIVQTSVIVPQYLLSAMTFGQVMGQTSLPANSTLNFIKPADMSTLMTCHPGMQSVIGSSLQPPLATPNPVNTPAALTEPLSAATAIPNTC